MMGIGKPKIMLLRLMVTVFLIKRQKYLPWKKSMKF